MIVDAQKDAIGHDIETDICIVGGGTAGIVLAREFIGRPTRICLLESGGLTPEPATQSLTIGDNIGQPYFPLDTARPRVFGGSGTRWNIPIGDERFGVRVRPLDPIDFEQRDWVPFSGWPFDKDQLDSYYVRAQAVCRVEPPTYDVSDWQNSETAPMPLNPSDVQTIIYKFSPAEAFVRDYPDQLARAANVTVCLHSNVLEIETNASGDCVSRLRVRTLGNKEFSVRAKVYVLAAGGIEVPRLLLLSNKIQKAGVGNQHDLVGRFFMEHPHFWSGLFFPNDRECFGKTGLYNQIHTVNGVAVVGKLALNERVVRTEKLLNQNVQLIPANLDPPTQAVPGVESARAVVDALRRGKKLTAPSEHVRNILSDIDSVLSQGAGKVKSMLLGRKQVPAFYFATMMEQIPNPESRVTLGPERDVFGQNRVQLDWKITGQDIRSAVRTLKIIGGALEKAGLGRFVPQLEGEIPPSNTEGGYHHMGTTRMSVDPKTGVVDQHCRVHGIGNLYIAGPSVFPTGGYANPVLTIIALTLRLADHLKAQGVLTEAVRATVAT